MKNKIINFLGFKPKRNLNISNRTAWTAAILIVVTQITDFTTTTIGLNFGATEGNSLMADFIHQNGILAFLAIKIVASIFLAWSTFRRKYAPWVIAGMYGLVTIWNCAIIVFVS
jgi:hypothetical protein